MIGKYRPVAVSLVSKGCSHVRPLLSLQNRSLCESSVRVHFSSVTCRLIPSRYQGYHFSLEAENPSPLDQTSSLVFPVTNPSFNRSGNLGAEKPRASLNMQLLHGICLDLSSTEQLARLRPDPAYYITGTRTSTHVWTVCSFTTCISTHYYAKIATNTVS